MKRWGCGVVAMLLLQLLLLPSPVSLNPPTPALIFLHTPGPLFLTACRARNPWSLLTPLQRPHSPIQVLSEPTMHPEFPLWLTSG